MDSYDEILDSFKEKIDSVLNLQIPRTIQECSKKISELEQQFQLRVGFFMK